jgi:hypothetical protein
MASVSSILGFKYLQLLKTPDKFMGRAPVSNRSGKDSNQHCYWVQCFNFSAATSQEYYVLIF